MIPVLIPTRPKPPFFHLTHAALHQTMSFATGKRTKAFYSAKENAPFASNPAEWAFSGKVCKTEGVFARNSGKGVSGGAIRGRIGAGLGGGG
jgi:predicted outer membrane repeat protein